MESKTSVHLTVKHNGKTSMQTVSPHSVLATKDEHIRMHCKDNVLKLGNAVSGANVLTVNFTDPENLKLSIDIDNFPRIAVEGAKKEPKKKKAAVDATPKKAANNIKEVSVQEQQAATKKRKAEMPIENLLQKLGELEEVAATPKVKKAKKALVKPAMQEEDD